MGIHNLFQLIKEYAPAAIRQIGISELGQKVIAVDASITIYQWCRVGRARHIVNNSGKFINHVQGAFFRISSMIGAGITPIFVFDGPPPAIKERTLWQRKERGANHEPIPREVFTEVMKLCALMGVTVVQAPSEAEAQAAHIHGVDIVATEDMDALAFGAKYMVRGLDTAAKSLMLIDTSILLAELGLSREQFVDLCILLGTDYTTTLPRIGYKLALALIKKYKNIEAIIAAILESGGQLPADFDYLAARAQFMAPVVNEDLVAPEIGGRQIDLVALREFLIDIHGLSAARVNKTLDKLGKIYSM